MRDLWSVNVAQTIVLVGATILAFLTYRANRRDRRNQVEERHLLQVADRVAEMSAAAEELKWGDRSGERTRMLQAQKRLLVALQFVGPHLADLETCEKLVSGELLQEPSYITDTLGPVAASEVADALGKLPEGPWVTPRWLQRLLHAEWRRTYSVRVEQPLRRRFRRRKDDDDHIHA